MKTLLPGLLVKLDACRHPLTVALGCRAVILLLVLGLVIQISPVLVQLARLVRTGIAQGAHTGGQAYFVGGGWRADARTLGAALHYLFDREPPPPVTQVALAATHGAGQFQLQVRGELLSLHFAPWVAPKRLLENNSQSHMRA